MEYFLAVANKIVFAWTTFFRWFALAVFLICFFGFIICVFTSSTSVWHWLIVALIGPLWMLLIGYVPSYAVKFMLINPLQEVFEKKQNKFVKS